MLAELLLGSESNYIKLTQDKCYFSLSGHKYGRVWVNILQTKIWNDRKQKLPRIMPAFWWVCIKAGTTFGAQTRICKFMSTEQWKLSFNRSLNTAYVFRYFVEEIQIIA